MIFSKRSALYIFVVVVCATAILFSVPYTGKAVELSSAPDWIYGQINFELLGDYDYHDGDQYGTLANIPAENISAGINLGSVAYPNITQQTHNVYPTAAGYVNSGIALPIGENRWQFLDGFYSDAVFPDPGTTGMIVARNAYDYYSQNIPRGTYYVDDWRTMYGGTGSIRYGTIVRRLSSSFSFDNETKLVGKDGREIVLPTTSGISYSKNGKWAYLDTREGRMRVEIPNMSYELFAPYFQPYYSLSTAISNSGKFIVEGSRDVGMVIYDLDLCGSSDVCTNRDLASVLRREYSKTLSDHKGLGELSVVGLKFASESVIDIYAWVTSVDSSGKYVHFQLSIDPGAQSVRYLALGDSFSSGEGAGDYYEATNFWADENDYNFCHQSRLAYSELLNDVLKPDFYDSVACSGAQMKDVVYGDTIKYFRQESQSKFSIYGSSTEDQDDYITKQLKNKILNVNPGYTPQLAGLQSNSPSIVTISIGGNDIGFKDIIMSCVINLNCYESRNDREKLADLVVSKIPKLAVTLSTLRQNMSGSNPKLYVLGYPQMFAESPCGSVIGLEEQRFANHLVDYLNASIRLAAEQAGVFYVDVTRAFVGDGEDHRLCGNATQAANGIFFDANNMPNGPVLNALSRALVSSYHPNALGHQLFASVIRQQTKNFSEEMPARVATSERPSISLYEALVGDTDDAYQELGNVSQDITKDTVVEKGQSVSVAYSLGKDDNGLPVEDATITVVAQSTPTTLGTLTVQTDGVATGNFALPPNLEPGIHTIHLLYNDISGQVHDVYQYIYVIANETDFDGDGIPNTQEKCVIGGSMGVDRDTDGLDDACDPEIAVHTTPEQTNSTKQQVLATNDTQRSTEQSIVNSELSGGLADTNIYFGASFETHANSGSTKDNTSTDDMTKEVIAPMTLYKMNISKYIILAICALVTVVMMIIYFVKRKQF